MEEVSKLVHGIVDKYSSRLNQLSQDIWNKPELNYEEVCSHQTLVSFLEEFGFNVEKHYILPTAFRAEYGRGNSPKVAVICEYDALPEIGHACGHNLIAEAGVAAALAIKNVLENQTTIQGKVVVLGTPAEEGGGGKIKLIEAGAFKDIDVALMVHPSPTDHLYPPFIGVLKLTVSYKGKAAHASGYPWEGLNALDAAVACYSNIAFLRQQIKPTCRIHAVITKGGKVPNVIPEETELKLYIRASNSRELDNLKKRVERCCIAAADATGCKVKVDFITDGQYDPLITNDYLARTYKKYAEPMGVEFLDGNPRYIPFMASSDIGNVSHVVPSIQPTYSIGTSAPNHSSAFTEASGSAKAQQPTLIAAKSMAFTAVEILSDPQLLHKIKEQFKKDLLYDAQSSD
ncbi:xaa-Arg dipeptidase-like [Centruroides vittatus]|uniref:xaa-Arg dipeptidase-like n=1 Tax=Centruroides vittatus TaxID=120091 RepID=UPI00350EAD1D